MAIINKDYQLNVKEENTTSFANKASSIDWSSNLMQDVNSYAHWVITKDFVPKDLMPRFSLPNIDNWFSPKLVNQTPILATMTSTPEKLTVKYQKIMQDAFDEWEDFTSGYRIKPKYFLYDDAESNKRMDENESNSRNLSKNKSVIQNPIKHQKLGMNTQKDTNDTITKKKEIISNSNKIQLYDVDKNKRTIYLKSHRDDMIFSSSVISKNTFKPVLRSENRYNIQKDVNNANKKDISPIPQRLPVIWNQIAVKEIHLKTKEFPQRYEKSNENVEEFVNVLPKVL